MKIRQAEAALFHAERRTDRQTDKHKDANSLFLQILELAWQRWIVFYTWDTCCTCTYTCLLAHRSSTAIYRTWCLYWNGCKAHLSSRRHHCVFLCFGTLINLDLRQR